MTQVQCVHGIGYKVHKTMFLKMFSQNIKRMKLRHYVIVSEGQYERVHMQCCPKHFCDKNLPLSVLSNMDSTIRCIAEVW